MTVTIDGTNGVTSPGITDTGNLSVTGTSAFTGSVGNITAGTVTASGLVTGATGALYPIVNGNAQASTSGTSIPFTGIPSWVKRITVMLYGVSTSSTNVVRVQLGTGGTPTYVTSGYAASAATIGSSSTTAIGAFTDGFPASRSSIAADTISSIMTIVNVTGNLWEASATTRTSGNTVFNVVSGQVDAGAAVTALRVTIDGTDTFDAGTINILYE